MNPEKPIRRMGEAPPKQAAVLCGMSAASGNIAPFLGAYASGYRLAIHRGPGGG